MAKLLFTVLFLTFIFPSSVLAQVTVDGYFPPSSLFGQTATYTPTGLLQAVVTLLLIGGGIVFLFVLLLSGIQYISSAGDKEATGKASRRLTFALVGLTLLLSVFLITRLLSVFFGVNLLAWELPSFATGAGRAIPFDPFPTERPGPTRAPTTIPPTSAPPTNTPVPSTVPPTPTPTPVLSSCITYSLAPATAYSVSFQLTNNTSVSPRLLTNLDIQWLSRPTARVTSIQANSTTIWSGSSTVPLILSRSSWSPDVLIQNGTPITFSVNFDSVRIRSDIIAIGTQWTDSAGSGSSICRTPLSFSSIISTPPPTPTPVTPTGCGWSCTDPDGGLNRLTRSTVTGWYNTCATFSYTDNCRSSTTLREYGCSGSTSYYTDINCAGYGGTCSNGRCTR